jgi:transposase
MIEADKRKAIFLLHQEGMPLREIARRLHVSRNTVAVVIAQGGQLPKLVRSPKQNIDSQLLRRLYEQCGGWIQRMHEKLAEEQGIEVKYSTLTRMLRQSGISKSQESRCGQVPDEPGAEMQHAGRSFLNINDLNRQAFQWATVRMEHRPQGKANLIPAKAFEHERQYLSQLPAHLPAPYQVHERGTDQYGYAAFEGNYYWVPGLSRQEVKILQYSDRLKIYLARECVATYPLPADGVTNQRFSPPELPIPPCQPNNRRCHSTEEEKRLRALDLEVSRYLDFVLESKTVQRHVFLRRLLALSQRMTPELFVKSVQRAHRYRITSLQTIERIALLQLAEGTAELPFAELDEGFRQRSAYQEGSLTDPPDLSIYQD